MPRIKKEKATKKKAKVEKSVFQEKGKKSFNLLKGMHDILPKDEKYWKNFFHVAENLAEHFQFARIETPALEELNLCVRSIGRGTDVVDKEVYSFEDRDGNKVCLRPEATASIVRAYILHGLWNASQPVKLWY